jgi:uncharacterized protein (DUF849 family)
MMQAKKVIITCAVTGSIHTPSMSDSLPITPDQIADQAIAAAEAGASMLHLHARDPDTGKPNQSPKLFEQCPASNNPPTPSSTSPPAADWA